MGLEATCTLRIGRRKLDGRAWLETNELVFRGEERLAIPYREIRSIAAEDGRLVVEHPGGTATFEIGEAAAKWADRIKHPRSRLTKLGVKPGYRVAVLDVDDRQFLKELAAGEARVVKALPAAAGDGLDLVFLGASAATDLKPLAKLTRAIARNGAIWVVWPKGRPGFREDDVRAAAIRAGLVDVKVVAFSATHSGLKLVIPVAKR
jgi:hypothetical protein